MVARHTAGNAGLDGILSHHTQRQLSRACGLLEYAITDHEYPLVVWAAGGVVQEHVQNSAAKLQAGGYAVLRGMYAPVTQMRAAVEACLGVVVDNRATGGI